jgi:hypothetical protein
MRTENDKAEHDRDVNQRLLHGRMIASNALFVATYTRFIASLQHFPNQSGPIRI